MDKIKILYKAKNNGLWVEGYPVIKDNKTYLFESETSNLLEVDENTLCKK